MVAPSRSRWMFAPAMRARSSQFKIARSMPLAGRAFSRCSIHAARDAARDASRMVFFVPPILSKNPASIPMAAPVNRNDLAFLDDRRIARPFRLHRGISPARRRLLPLLLPVKLRLFLAGAGLVSARAGQPDIPRRKSRDQIPGVLRTGPRFAHATGCGLPLRGGLFRLVITGRFRPALRLRGARRRLCRCLYRPAMFPPLARFARAFSGLLLRLCLVTLGRLAGSISFMKARSRRLSPSRRPRLYSSPARSIRRNRAGRRAPARKHRTPQAPP